MKTNKIIKTILVAVISLATITIYSKAVNIPNNANSISVQSQTPEVRILGMWIMENSPNDKVEFLANGQMKRYHGSSLLYIDIYSISNACGGDISGDNLLYLIQTDSEDGDEYCYVIVNGVYADNSEVLTLITEGQGKIIVYVRP